MISARRSIPFVARRPPTDFGGPVLPIGKTRQKLPNQLTRAEIGERLSNPLGLGVGFPKRLHENGFAPKQQLARLGFLTRLVVNLARDAVQHTELEVGLRKHRLGVRENLAQLR